MSTYLALVNRLILECGITGTSLTTVVGATGEMDRLVKWTASAWQDIQAERQDWQFLRATTAFPLTTGRTTYTTAQCGITANTFGMWARDTFRNYVNPTITMTIDSPGVVTLVAHGLSVGNTITFATTGALPTGITAGTAYYVLTVPSADTMTLAATAGGAVINTSGTQSGTHTATSNNTTTFIGMQSEVLMTYQEYESWRNNYLFGNLRFTTSRPLINTITPDKSIGLGPIGIAGYTVLGDYFTAPVDLTADADIPALPVQFHMAIVYRAMMSYGGYESATEVYQRGELEFNKMMRRIHADRLPEISFGGALI